MNAFSSTPDFRHLELNKPSEKMKPKTSECDKEVYDFYYSQKCEDVRFVDTATVLSL